ncbi:unnamed protein product [Effrenium voratum]|uniref:K Homology domain-containing protein n=1 Tax=Effrenium voratum TaxID=2562239 RepID=A0AA36JC58_9DINO|nr:unnamed protein product [Effrenium voratum]CAJ1403495.1 unnamed protein product [Effrenium voratum]
MLRCLVPAEATALIVGDDGAIAEQIAEESGAHVTVSDDGDTPSGLSDRIVSIIGSQDQRQAACRRILECLYGAQEVESGEQGIFVLLVDQDSMGAEGLQRARDVSGAEIHEEADDIPGTDARVIQIVGGLEATLVAVKELSQEEEEEEALLKEAASFQQAMGFWKAKEEGMSEDGREEQAEAKAAKAALLHAPVDGPGDTQSELKEQPVDSTIPDNAEPDAEGKETERDFVTEEFLEEPAAEVAEDFVEEPAAETEFPEPAAETDEFLEEPAEEVLDESAEEILEGEPAEEAAPVKQAPRSSPSAKVSTGRQSACFAVAPAVAAWVVGRRGQSITDLRSRSGAKIEVSKEGSPRVIEIHGSAEAVSSAIELLLEQASMLPDGGPEVVRMVLPAGTAGYIIGRGGEAIKELRRSSEADVGLERDGPGSQLLTIRGTQQAMTLAAQLVAARLAEVTGEAKPRSDADCLKALLAESDQSEARLTILLPAEAVNQVPRARLRQLEQQSGSKIEVHLLGLGGRSSEVHQLTVAGTRSGNAQAVLLLQELFAKHLRAPPPGSGAAPKAAPKSIGRKVSASQPQAGKGAAPRRGASAGRRERNEGGRSTGARPLSREPRTWTAGNAGKGAGARRR